MILKGEGPQRLMTGRLIKDATYRQVGDKKTDLLKFAVAFGEGKNDIVNCAVWRELARRFRALKKNDRVLVSGAMESNEYQGKTYWTLNVDYMNSPDGQPAGTEGAAKEAAVTEGFKDIQSDDIPF